MEAAQTLDLHPGSSGSIDLSSFFEARRAYRDLETWVTSEALDLPSHQVEEQMLVRGREVQRILLQAHLILRGTGNHGRILEVIEGEEARRHEAGSVRPKQLNSIFGDVVARRTPYLAAERTSIHPLDEELQLPERSYSYALQRRVVEESVRGPYDETVESVEKSTGVVVPKRSAELIVQEAAADFDAFYEQRTAVEEAGSGPILVTAVDCKGIPLVRPEGAKKSVVRRTKGEKANKKKMATVATVYTTAPRVRTPEEVVVSLFDDDPPEKRVAVRPENKRVWASLEKSKEDVFRGVVTEVELRDPRVTKMRVAVADGERALQKLIRKLLSGFVLILDLLHVLEKLWAVGHALYGEGTKEAEDWVREHALMILQGRVSQVVKGIRQSATKRKLRGARAKVLKNVARYLYRNRAYMRYHEYLAQGLPIASGAVEGACKNLVKDRMERSGMRWQIAGAEAMLKLRAVKLSGDFEAYWAFHIQQDQKRLYGFRRWRAA